MKNIFLFIGLGLLLSGCETNDSKIYLECIGIDVITYGLKDPLPRESAQQTHMLILDEVRKHISIQNVTEGTYTEKDNIIFSENLHAPHGLDDKGSLIDLQLNKTSGRLSVTKYEEFGGRKVRPPLFWWSYQCENTEVVI